MRLLAHAFHLCKTFTKLKDSFPACMQVTFNPKDSNTFASASLDRTVKVWSIGQPTPNFTLEGHEKGVNAVDYFTGGESPHPRCSVEPSRLEANLPCLSLLSLGFRHLRRSHTYVCDCIH